MFRECSKSFRLPWMVELVAAPPPGGEPPGYELSPRKRGSGACFSRREPIARGFTLGRPGAGRSILGRLRLALAAAAMAFFLFPTAAHASTGGGVLPFVDSLRIIMQDVTGPVATILIFIGIAIALVAWGTSDRHDKIVTAGKALVALAIIATLGGTLLMLGINAATV